MAELTTSAETTANSCCAPEAQATCCEPSAKVECCGPSHGEGCGCAAGTTTTQAGDIRQGLHRGDTTPDASVDVVISNCVINLSGDKPKVLREVARVLRPGGRFAVSDVIADENMDDATRADIQAYTGCIAGALTHREFTQALADAGLAAVEIRETHRVHAQAASAIVRAQKPAALAASESTAAPRARRPRPPVRLAGDLRGPRPPKPRKHGRNGPRRPSRVFGGFRPCLLAFAKH